MEKVDVVVIGAGVLGCCAARELSRYQLDVLVLERAHDVGEGSSKANSGIIHAGFHARGGSLKGKSCVEGNKLHRAMAREMDIPLVECGGMMVAFNGEGVEKLHAKAERAYLNGAGKLDIVDGAAARAMEPRLSPRVVAALMAPTTCVISPFELVLALAQNAQRNGVRFRFKAEVETVLPAQSGGWLVRLTDGAQLEARCVLNMAGDMACLIDKLVGPDDYQVQPRAGDFIVFDKQAPETAVKRVIYQAAENDEGGTLVAPTVEGNLLAGPTSRDAASFLDTASVSEGLEHVMGVARKLLPDLGASQVIHNFAGVRTNITNVPKEAKDFVLRASAPGFVSAIGIKNPGMTSAPALAKRAVRMLEGQGLALVDDPSFDPRRVRYVPFLLRSAQQQRALLREDPRYGNVVCRCECITEGDIRAVMHEPVAPSTLSGLKRRLRCGMGRCQGSFCAPRVVCIMADELGVSESSILAGEWGGHFVLRSVK